MTMSMTHVAFMTLASEALPLLGNLERLCLWFCQTLSQPELAYLKLEVNIATPEPLTIQLMIENKAIKTVLFLPEEATKVETFVFLIPLSQGIFGYGMSSKRTASWQHAPVSLSEQMDVTRTRYAWRTSRQSIFPRCVITWAPCMVIPSSHTLYMFYYHFVCQQLVASQCCQPSVKNTETSVI